MLLARVLGVEDYGWFAGLAGLAVAVGGLTGVGQGLRMYRDGARDRLLLAPRWGQATTAVLGSGLLFALVLVSAVAVSGVPVPLQWLAMLAVAEIVMMPLATQVAFACAAAGRVVTAAAVPVLPAALRLAAIAWLWLSSPETPGLHAYLPLHLLATIGAVLVLYLFAMRRLMLGWRPLPIAGAEFRDGLSFSGLWATGLALGSVDKTVSLHWGGAALAGNYAIAQRLGAIAATPVEALAMAALPRLFGQERRRLGTLVATMFVAALIYGTVAGLLLAQAVWIVPHLLGPGFGDIAAASLVALYVPLYCLRQVAASVLLGADAVRWRTGAEVAAIVALVVLMAWRVPAAGIDGALQALVAAEAFLLAMMVVVVPRVVRGRPEDP